MTNNTQFSLTEVAKYVSLVTLFLLPLLVLPFTEQFISDSKQYLLFAAMLVIGFLYVGHVLTKRMISFAVTPLTLPLALFGVAVLASTFFTGNYPVEHLLGLGGTYIAAVVIALLAGSLTKDKDLSTKVVTVFGASGVLLSLASGLQMAGFGPSHIFDQILPFNLPHDMLFNLSGSTLVATQVLAIILVGLVGQIVAGKANVVHKAATVIVAVGLLVNGWTLLPGNLTAPNFLPLRASWSVAADILKAPRTALIGVGPSSFGNAYNQFKPLFINNTDQWNLPFTQGTNLPFTLFVTTGLIGLAAWLFLVVRVVRQTKEVSSEGRVLHWMLLATFAIQLLIPASPVLLGIQALILAFWVAVEHERFMVVEIHGLALRFVKKFNPDRQLTNHAKMVLYSFAGAFIIGLGFLSYAVGRAYAAQVRLYEAAKAGLNNDGLAVYENQRAAARLNPYMDTIRRRYALTNLTIASVISQQADQTEQQAQQVSQLIQQAIREGRAATLLDPNDTNNWQAVAQIYQALIGTAEQADQWTVTSYVNAIQTAPNNPNVRLALGGVLFGQEQYDEAAQIFQQAVNVKPDHANTYYSLANSFAMLERLPDAKAAYQQALRLLDPASESYQQVSDELAALEERISEQPASGDAEAQAGQESVQTPSITTQNTESPTEVINQPAGGDGLPINAESIPPASQQTNPEEAGVNSDSEGVNPDGANNGNQPGQAIPESDL